MMPRGWEGNRLALHWPSGHASLTVLGGLSTYGLNGHRKGDEPPEEHGTFYLFYLLKCKKNYNLGLIHPCDGQTDRNAMTNKTR